MTDAAAADELIELCAYGEAAWQAAAYGWLGATWTFSDDIAWGQHVPHRFLLGAVTLGQDPALPDRLTGTIRDSWGALSSRLGQTHRAEPADPWMVRPAGPSMPPQVPGLTIEPAADAEMFEQVAFIAAGGEPPGQPGELHPRGSERTPGLHLLVAQLDGQLVGSALALIHARGLLVSAVAVVAAHRGRGIGASLTSAAINCAAGRPATLSSSSAGMGMYRRLGFEIVGSPLDWKPIDPD